MKTSKAIALCDEGMQHTSDTKSIKLFQEIKELLTATDTTEERPSVKQAKKSSTKRGR